MNKNQFTSTAYFLLVAACQPPQATWHLMLAHDKEGTVAQGSTGHIISAVRQGCQIRVAWGARRAADPNQTIEHIAEPQWVAIRNNNQVEVQISGFLANQSVLGEPPKDHPRRERFGGTVKAVEWRATLKTDGNFDAIWLHPHTGELVTRIPQRHPMKWFADCLPKPTSPLYPD